MRANGIKGSELEIRIDGVKEDGSRGEVVLRADDRVREFEDRTGKDSFLVSPSPLPIVMVGQTFLSSKQIHGDFRDDSNYRIGFGDTTG